MLNVNIVQIPVTKKYHKAESQKVAIPCTNHYINGMRLVTDVHAFFQNLYGYCTPVTQFKDTFKASLSLSDKPT